MAWIECENFIYVNTDHVIKIKGDMNNGRIDIITDEIITEGYDGMQFTDSASTLFKNVGPTWVPVVTGVIARELADGRDSLITHERIYECALAIIRNEDEMLTKGEKK